MPIELWKSGVAAPRAILNEARRTEAAGWDGLMVVDSQNLSGDAYVALAMAATVTERIGLGTGVTNSVTRVAAVTAGAIASVHRVSDGRATLGIGRGDSALAHLGRAPGRVAHFERYLRHLQTYLRGESVPFDELQMPIEIAPPMSALELADAPPASRIDWIADLNRRLPKVLVEVAATGPRVIAIAALHADRIMFALGAEPQRIAWGMQIARDARLAAGLDPDGIRFGAYVQCAAHPDLQIARDLVRGGTTTFARFSVMHGKTAAPVSESQGEVLDALRRNYDMRAHTRGDSRQAGVLTEAFIDRFAIVGPPEQVVARIEELAALGLDKLSLTTVGRGTAEAQAERAREILEREVLPCIDRQRAY